MTSTRTCPSIYFTAARSNHPLFSFVDFYAGYRSLYRNDRFAHWLEARTRPIMSLYSRASFHGPRPVDLRHVVARIIVANYRAHATTHAHALSRLIKCNIIMASAPHNTTSSFRDKTIIHSCLMLKT